MLRRLIHRIARHRVRIALGLLLAAAGSAWIARAELARQREAFDTDARIVHRLLSQQVVQHDAILQTLGLLQPDDAAAPQRLSALYPQVIGVVRRAAGQPWPDDALARAARLSAELRRGVLADLDFAAERYRVALAAMPAGYALVIHARNMVPWDEWPMDRATSPVEVALEQSGQRLVLQPGDGRSTPAAAGWRFEFHKHLASPSQPFDVVLRRQVGWLQLPWGWMALWCAAVALAMAAQGAWQRQRAARRRAEELLRLGQVARLNTLGELAAGLAHELNQPLTAVLANTQAAGRLLADEPPDLATARDAMQRAAAQARRASDVVGRLRRTIEPAGATLEAAAVDLTSVAREALELLEPEIARREVQARIDAPGAVLATADPVAVQQVVHNLLMNALQALERVPPTQRRLVLRTVQDGRHARLQVQDTGPGIAPEMLPRIFEPFFSTREGGLGLGLGLCESLTQQMGGTLVAESEGTDGARFTLTLPAEAE